MIVRELVTKLGFQYDPTPVKKADADTDALKGKLEGLLGLFTAGAIAAGFQRLVHGAVEVASRLNDTANQFGISTEALQRFQYTAGLAGVKAEQFNAAMGPLSRQIFAAGEGSKEAAGLFHKFGIAFKDSKGELLPTEEVIGNIAERISKIESPAEQAGLAMKFFGRAGAKLVPVLKGGREALRQAGLGMERLGGPIAQETIESLDTLGDRTDELHTSFTNLKVVIASYLAPALTSVVTWLGTAVGSFRKIVENSRLAQSAMLTLAGVMAFFALRAVIALAPVLLPIMGIAAGIGLLVLGFDELWVTFKGGDSLLNRFVKWCTDSTVKAEGLLGVIKAIGNEVFTLGDKVYDFLHPDEAKSGQQGKNGGPIQTKYVDENGKFLQGEDGVTYQKVEAAYDERQDWLSRKLFGKLQREHYVPVGAPGGDINDLAPMGAGGEGGYNTLGPGDINDLAPMVRPQGGGATNVKNDVQIEVHAAPGMSAADVGIEVKRQFQDEMTKAVKGARAATLPSVPAGGQ